MTEHLPARTGLSVSAAELADLGEALKNYLRTRGLPIETKERIGELQARMSQADRLLERREATRPSLQRRIVTARLPRQGHHG